MRHRKREEVGALMIQDLQVATNMVFLGLTNEKPPRMCRSPFAGPCAIARRMMSNGKLNYWCEQCRAPVRVAEEDRLDELGAAE